MVIVEVPLATPTMMNDAGMQDSCQCPRTFGIEETERVNNTHAGVVSSLSFRAGRP